MSYQAKKTITSLIASLIIFISYCLSVLNDVSAAIIMDNDYVYWARKMLLFILIGILINIVLHIVFHIYLSINLSVKQGTKDNKEINRKLELEMVEDEMDKLIELKSLRVGYIVVSIGFISALAYLAFGSSLVIGLNIMYLSFYIGSFVEGLTNLFFYFRGIRNA